MDTKHNDDILKTMKREPLKERDGQPPSTPQPKKQCRFYELDILSRNTKLRDTFD